MLGRVVRRVRAREEGREARVEVRVVAMCFCIWAVEGPSGAGVSEEKGEGFVDCVG